MSKFITPYLNLQENFRIYYNQTLYPELWRLERARHRTLIGLILGGISFLIFVVAELVIKLPFLNFVFIIAAAFVISTLGLSISRYKRTFKPRIVGLILDFLDNQASYGTLKYFPEGFFPQALFVRSQLFGGPFTLYQGEDLISGSIGDLPFALCELNVETPSPIRDQLEVVFRGVLLQAKSSIRNEGNILVLPRNKREQWAGVVEDFIKAGGRNVDKDFNRPDFSQQYAVFASPEAWIDTRFSDEMETELLGYTQRSGRDLALSFIGQEIYLALWQDKDLLEPQLWRNNNSFDLVQEFFEDLTFMLSMVQDLDKSN